jgi:hypothetical protein
MSAMTLEPCPFCGMEVEYVTRPVSYGREFWYVYHPEHPSGNCILEDRKFSSASCWNHRAHLTAHAQMMEQVREVADWLAEHAVVEVPGMAEQADKLRRAIGDSHDHA